ncbi:DUF4333 domain-containing protein [Micromonospora tarensis]|uniref:DUF4333 domain-containing protein n=1 Tax=Micromonospora tarensis TaxID=2806100 RepID=A0ABS1YIL6_9ACTN|nr:DUF4333 domain-containing protein [Micromonospora tarensis]MBM0277248.1 DUF4333 domain-containing protein [Micromonospora tarensis]
MTNPYGSLDGSATPPAAAPPAPRWTPAPPPQFGPSASGPETGRAPRRGVSPKLVAAIGGPVVLAVVLVLGLLWPGFLNRKVFDTAALQRGVLTVLRENYQLDADEVACPVAPPVKVNSRFSCSARIAGQPKTVTVTVTSSAGRFEVGRPD